MIARLSGRLAHKSPEFLVVDVHGVGYQVFVSLNTFSALPEVGTEVQLEIQTQLRENALELFGFRDAREKALFGLLLTVAGVGPRMALAVLSGIAADELCDALAGGNLARLVSVPGVGKKRAERLVVELQDRVRLLRGRQAVEIGTRGGIEMEAASALVNLGYRQTEAERVVREVVQEGNRDLGDVIRLALRRLSGGG